MTSDRQYVMLWTEILRDDIPTRLLRCPVCGEWGEIDADQFDGYVSVDHTSTGRDDANPDDGPTMLTGCTFHEKINVRVEGEYVKPEHYHALAGIGRTKPGDAQ